MSPMLSALLGEPAFRRKDRRHAPIDIITNEKSEIRAEADAAVRDVMAAVRELRGKAYTAPVATQDDA